MSHRSARRALLAGLLSACATSVACVTSTPEHPLPMKLTTVPPGAEVELVERGILLVTPCAFPVDFRTYDPLVIRKAGYVTFEGALKDIFQVAKFSYELRLKPAEEGAGE